MIPARATRRRGGAAQAPVGEGCAPSHLFDSETMHPSVSHLLSTGGASAVHPQSCDARPSSHRSDEEHFGTRIAQSPHCPAPLLSLIPWAVHEMSLSTLRSFTAAMRPFPHCRGKTLCSTNRPTPRTGLSDRRGAVTNGNCQSARPSLSFGDGWGSAHSQTTLH